MHGNKAVWKLPVGKNKLKEAETMTEKSAVTQSTSASTVAESSVKKGVTIASFTSLNDRQLEIMLR
jgi:hypothetical protein